MVSKNRFTYLSSTKMFVTHEHKRQEKSTQPGIILPVLWWLVLHFFIAIFNICGQTVNIKPVPISLFYFKTMLYFSTVGAWATVANLINNLQS